MQVLHDRCGRLSSQVDIPGAYTGAMTLPASPPSVPRIAFIGGGNMASAILGGLLRAGHPVDRVRVVEPWEPQAQALRGRFGIDVDAAGGPALQDAGLVVWAVKPQVFAEAARPCAAYVGKALQLSVMAGLRCEAITAATGAARVVRAMPNTPALVGEGIAGLVATEAVSRDDRALVERVLASTGETLWVDAERDLDAVTALSGSGPAYVFYFVEAMMQAGIDMGLSAEHARRLALATFKGATALARASDDPLDTLRARVTSKGGTTHAAISAMEASGIKASIVQAVRAAQARARELGDEFGRPA